MFLKLDSLQKTREIRNHPSSSFKVGKFQGHLNGYLINSTWCGASKETHSWARLESETSGAVSRRKKIMTDISIRPVHTHNITQLWFLVAFKPVLSLSNAESDLLLDKQPMLLWFLAFAVFSFSPVFACNPPIHSCLQEHPPSQKYWRGDLRLIRIPTDRQTAYHLHFFHAKPLLSLFLWVFCPSSSSSSSSSSRVPHDQIFRAQFQYFLFSYLVRKLKPLRLWSWASI